MARIVSEIVIIGAGPAGLAVAACLQRAGKVVRVLEKSDRVAFRWHNHYDRLHLHTALENSGLPFHPIPDEIPRYPRREDVIDYLEAYADEERIFPEFNTEVTRVSPCERGWVVATNRGEIEARFVILGSGYNNIPVRPLVAGEETFPGSIIHGSEYRNAGPFENQRVLVVGFGNTAGEIALDLAEGGGIPTVSVRGPVAVIPRDLLGIPVQDIAKFLSNLPNPVADRISKWAGFARYGSLKRYGLERSEKSAVQIIREDRKIPVIDVGVMSAIRRGAISVRPGIDRIEGDLIRFVDGTSGSFDALVLATGYRDGIEDYVDVKQERIAAFRERIEEQPFFGSGGLYACGMALGPYGMLSEISREAPLIAADIVEKSG